MPPATLVARALRVDYSGHLALDRVDVEIAAGALTVIVGANGAGKSTLLEVLAGARDATSGTVETGTKTRAFVPQRAAIAEHLPLTVRDMVLVGAWGRRGPAGSRGAAQRAAVDDAMERLDIGPLARHPFSSLSGGQRQRALLAQGLARGADILLLDEPTTGLDAASAARIRAAVIDEARRGASVICVSHDDRLIADADQLIDLVAGRIRPVPRSGA